MIINKIQTHCIYIIISIAATLTFLSCNLFMEPEPYINKDAHSLTLDTTTAILSNYFMNQVVTGNIDPILLLNSSTIDSIRFNIDSTFVSSFKKPPYQSQINTRIWSKGKHNLIYSIYEKNHFGDSAGILRLLPPIPAHIYKTSLIFDGNSLVTSMQPTHFADNVGDAVLFMEDPGKFELFSTQNCSIINSQKLSINKIVAQSKSPDGKNLTLVTEAHYLDYQYHIYFLDLATLEVKLDYLLTVYIDLKGFVAGNNNRVYYSDDQGYLKVLDIEYYTKNVNSYNFFDGPARFLSISPDGFKLLAIDNKGVKSYSISGNSVVFSAQSQISDRIGVSYIDWINSRIFVGRQNTLLESWDIQSLTPSSSFNLPPSIPAAADITALMINSRFLYAAYTIQDTQTDSSLVAEYDIASQTLTRSWKYGNIVHSLHGSDNGRYIFAITFKDQWIIDLKETL